MKQIKNMVAGLTLGAIAATTIISTTGFSGCQHITWTPELAYQTAYCAGITAGAVIDSKKLAPEVTDSILGGMDKCRSAIPNVGQTFTQCWTPLMEEYLATKTDIPDATKALIKTGFGVITAAIDIEAVKHPEIVQSQEYIRAVADGLLNGVQYYVKPSNANACDDCCRDCTLLAKRPQIDYELFKVLDQRLR